MGLLPVRTGSISFNNTEVICRETCQICSLGIGFSFQERSVFPTLSVLEHLEMATVNAFNGRNQDEILKEVLELFPDLESRLNDKGATLSGGEGQMVQLAMAIVRRPKLLLLDEPSAGLSAKNVRNLVNKLRELQGEMTMLIAEQNIRTALDIADNFIILNEGSIIYQDTVKDIDKGEEIVKKYILV